MMLPFFVYGTLLPDQPNYHLWANSIVGLQSARLSSARLFDMGHYPMLIEGGDDVVVGAVVRLWDSDYARLVKTLDNLEQYDPNDEEQSIYLRVARDVVLADGSQCRAWVYVGKSRYVGGMDAFGGDWVTYSAEKQASLSHWWQDHNLTNDPTLSRGEP